MHDRNCKHCNSKLSNTMRSDAKYCSDACRAASWRLAQVPVVTFKLTLTAPQLDTLQREADDYGVAIHNLMLTKVIQPLPIPLPV